MSVVLLIAVLVILVAVFFVATGRGGELASEHTDYPPLGLGRVTAADIALLRPPTALWGYNMEVTDEALDRIARAVRDRDVTIAHLQRQLADLGPGTHPAAHSPGAKPGPGLAAEPASGPVAEPGPGLAAEPGPGLAAEPGPGPTAEPASGPAAEPGPGPSAASERAAPQEPPARPAGADSDPSAADDEGW